MPDFRCYAPEAAEGCELIRLSEEESRHLIAANRGRGGDEVVAFDGRGSEFDCQIEKADKREAVLRIRRHRPATPPPFSVTLLQAIPKGKGIESIIRRATELGARRIIPLLSQNTEFKLPKVERRQETKSQKWLAAAIEGAKQSGNPFLPAIEDPVEFRQGLPLSDRADLKLLACLRAESVTVRSALDRYLRSNEGRLPTSLAWLVGPEGDFTREESDAALAAGFIPVTLGPYVLRCETAAVAALAAVASELSG